MKTVEIPNNLLISDDILTDVFVRDLIMSSCWWLHHCNNNFIRWFQVTITDSSASVSWSSWDMRPVCWSRKNEACTTWNSKNLHLWSQLCGSAVVLVVLGSPRSFTFDTRVLSGIVEESLKQSTDFKLITSCLLITFHQLFIQLLTFSPSSILKQLFWWDYL